MKYFENSSRFFLIVSLTCAASLTLAQSRKAFSDCDSVFLQKYYNGDTVLIHCDTVMMMNLKTFLTYKKSFDKFVKGNATLKDLINNYENTIRIQGNMISRQEEYYQLVKSKFDSVSGNSLAFADKTSNSLNNISALLASANERLVETKSLIGESQKMLIEDQRKSFARKLKIGLGGFAIGVGITTLIFLVSN